MVYRDATLTDVVMNYYSLTCLLIGLMKRAVVLALPRFLCDYMYAA